MRLTSPRPPRRRPHRGAKAVFACALALTGILVLKAYPLKPAASNAQEADSATSSESSQAPSAPVRQENAPAPEQASPGSSSSSTPVIDASASSDISSDDTGQDGMLAPIDSIAVPPDVSSASSSSSSAPVNGMPMELLIPSIGVQTVVENVGITGDGKLDVPKGRLNAGWYNLGPRPGDTGNAVIDGHLDLAHQQGVFWNLHKLQRGDEIDVINDQGHKEIFRVRDTQTFSVYTPPMAAIFGPSDGKHLNLITCAGVWRKELNHYDARFVAFADYVRTE